MNCSLCQKFSDGGGQEFISEAGQGYTSCPPPNKEEWKGFKQACKWAEWNCSREQQLRGQSLTPPGVPLLTSQAISALRSEVLEEHR